MEEKTATRARQHAPRRSATRCTRCRRSASKSDVLLMHATVLSSNTDDTKNKASAEQVLPESATTAHPQSSDSTTCRRRLQVVDSDKLFTFTTAERCLRTAGTLAMVNFGARTIHATRGRHSLRSNLFLQPLQNS